VRVRGAVRRQFPGKVIAREYEQKKKRERERERERERPRFRVTAVHAGCADSRRLNKNNAHRGIAPPLSLSLSLSLPHRMSAPASGIGAILGSKPVAVVELRERASQGRTHPRLANCERV